MNTKVDWGMVYTNSIYWSLVKPIVKAVVHATIFCFPFNILSEG